MCITAIKYDILLKKVKATITKIIWSCKQSWHDSYKQGWWRLISNAIYKIK